MKGPTLDKRTFKICEAVHLGIDYYYMGRKDRRELTDEDRKIAERVLPTLADRWWEEPQDWQVFGRSGNRIKRGEE